MTERSYRVLFAILVGETLTDHFDFSFLCDIPDNTSSFTLSKSQTFLNHNPNAIGFHSAVFHDGSQRIVCPVVLSLIFKLALGIYYEGQLSGSSMNILFFCFLYRFSPLDDSDCPSRHFVSGAG